MMHATALAISWRDALLSLVEGHRNLPSDSPDPADTPPDENESTDDEREPFHLDDTELANRLVRDRGLVHYQTPPNTHRRTDPHPGPAADS